MSTDEWLSPARVAARILEATGVVDVTDPNSKAWAGAWSGYTSRDPQLEVRGLKSKLMEEPYVTHYYPPPEEKLHAVCASRLLNFLGRYTKPEDQTHIEASPSGEPKWIYHEGQLELWFRWAEAWSAIGEESRGQIPPGKIVEVSKRVREITAEAEFPHGFRKGRTGTNMRFTRWTDRHLRALESVAGAAPGPAGPL